jgi:PIN domain nuclease of toxin-antitoxin system
MRYLLDTNILLWFITGNDNLNHNLYETIAYSNSVYTSIISLQEIAIKNRDGKLILTKPFDKLAERLEQEANIKILVTIQSLYRNERLA